MSTLTDDIRYFQAKADANKQPLGKKRYLDVIDMIHHMIANQRYKSAMEAVTNDRKEIRT